VRVCVDVSLCVSVCICECVHFSSFFQGHRQYEVRVMEVSAVGAMGSCEDTD